jgi:stearoyl-CoA desaturase (delta-9 desaturase)
MHNESSAKPYAEIIPTSEKNWITLLFVSLTPFVAIALAILYVSREGFALGDLVSFLVMWVLTGMSITVGYHRYFSHRSFDCHPALQLLTLLFGAASVQNSLLAWASNHRYHHQFTDKEGDPYNINKGFFWAHMGWMFFKEPAGREYRNAPDLKKNPLVMWQHRHYLLLAVLVGAVLPTLIGAAFGRPFGGFLWGGLIRLVFAHQTTFMINSVAHTIGKKTYSRSATARNNPILALVSFGEGYHSFHHEFPSDYRNGVAWYQFDPGKWLIGALGWVGVTSHLKRTPPAMLKA